MPKSRRSAPGGQSQASVTSALEDVAVSWVIRDLDEEGHSVREIGKPDRDGTLRPELLRRPDSAIELDGEPAAIEATRFKATASSAAAARASEIQDYVRDGLRARADGRSVTASVSFDEAKLLARPRRMMVEDAERILAAIVSLTVSVGEGQSLSLDAATHPSWVRASGVTISRDHRAVIGLWLHSPREDVADRVDAFLRRSWRTRPISTRGGVEESWP